jgi:hypothetical protein
MGTINWGRVFRCGLVAGLVWVVLATVFTKYLGYPFAAAVPGGKLYAPSVELVVFLLALDLVMGIWAMWLYAAIRPRYGAGPKTAAMAGVAWWVITSLVDATWGSFGFVPWMALLPLMGASLPAIVVAALVGAWSYKE